MKKPVDLNAKFLMQELFNSWQLQVNWCGDGIVMDYKFLETRPASNGQ